MKNYNRRKAIRTACRANCQLSIINCQ